MVSIDMNGKVEIHHAHVFESKPVYTRNQYNEICEVKHLKIGWFPDLRCHEVIDWDELDTPQERLESFIADNHTFSYQNNA